MKNLQGILETGTKPAVYKDLEKYDSTENKKNTKEGQMPRPRGAQIEALYALENSRAEGAVKGLVQAATGVGKTYLAAFDSENIIMYYL